MTSIMYLLITVTWFTLMKRLLCIVYLYVGQVCINDQVLSARRFKTHCIFRRRRGLRTMETLTKLSKFYKIICISIPTELANVLDSFNSKVGYLTLRNENRKLQVMDPHHVQWEMNYFPLATDADVAHWSQISYKENFSLSLSIPIISCCSLKKVCKNTSACISMQIFTHTHNCHWPFILI